MYVYSFKMSANIIFSCFKCIIKQKNIDIFNIFYSKIKTHELKNLKPISVLDTLGIISTEIITIYIENKLSKETDIKLMLEDHL